MLKNSSNNGSNSSGHISIAAIVEVLAIFVEKKRRNGKKQGKLSGKH